MLDLSAHQQHCEFLLCFSLSLASSLSFFFSLVNIASGPSEIEMVHADVFLYILEYSLFHSRHVAYANIFNLSSTRKSKFFFLFFLLTNRGRIPNSRESSTLAEIVKRKAGE